MTYEIQSVNDIRKLLRTELSDLYNEKEIDSVSKIILKTLFGADRLHLLLSSGTSVSNEMSQRVGAMTEALKTGMPLQYVLGETEFYGMKIKVDHNVLIPRPETEELADLVIRENKGPVNRIIDFCTGSGCLAIALAKNLRLASILGTDISPGAIEVAKENAKLNRAEVKFMISDIFGPLPPGATGTGIIVSNPPYVRDSERELMHINVKGFEPPAALFVPDNDPLKFYRRLFEISAEILLPRGRFYFEINEALGEMVSAMAREYGFNDVGLIKDLNSRDRFIKGVLNG